MTSPQITVSLPTYAHPTLADIQERYLNRPLTDHMLNAMRLELSTLGYLARWEKATNSVMVLLKDQVVTSEIAKIGSTVSLFQARRAERWAHDCGLDRAHIVVEPLPEDAPLLTRQPSETPGVFYSVATNYNRGEYLTQWAFLQSLDIVKTFGELWQEGLDAGATIEQLQHAASGGIPAWTMEGYEPGVNRTMPVKTTTNLSEAMLFPTEQEATAACLAVSENFRSPQVRWLPGKPSPYYVFLGSTPEDGYQQIYLAGFEPRQGVVEIEAELPTHIGLRAGPFDVALPIGHGIRVQTDTRD